MGKFEGKPSCKGRIVKCERKRGVKNVWFRLLQHNLLGPRIVLTKQLPLIFLFLPISVLIQLHGYSRESTTFQGIMGKSSSQKNHRAIVVKVRQHSLMCPILTCITCPRTRAGKDNILKLEAIYAHLHSG